MLHQPVVEGEGILPLLSLEFDPGAVDRKLPLEEEVHVHDVMNIFMCTGYTRDTHQYFMKASPVPPAIS